VILLPPFGPCVGVTIAVIYGVVGGTPSLVAAILAPERRAHHWSNRDERKLHTYCKRQRGQLEGKAHVRACRLVYEQHTLTHILRRDTTWN
jgi:hypothetical protein